MGPEESARSNYESAHAELISHFQLRDSVLLTYITATGTIFGISLGTSAKSEILLAIPYFSLGCSILVSQHNLLIGSLLDFMTEEIAPFLQHIKSNECAPFYVTSKSYKRNAMRALRLRFLGHSILMLLPCLIALSFNFKYSIGHSMLMGFIWWGSLICTIVAFCFLYSVQLLRTKHHREKQAVLKKQNP